MIIICCIVKFKSYPERKLKQKKRKILIENTLRERRTEKKAKKIQIKTKMNVFNSIKYHYIRA